MAHSVPRADMVDRLRRSHTAQLQTSQMDFPDLALACPTLTLFSFWYVWGPAFPEGRIRLLSGLKIKNQKLGGWGERA